MQDETLTCATCRLRLGTMCLIEGNRESVMNPAQEWQERLKADFIPQFLPACDEYSPFPMPPPILQTGEYFENEGVVSL